MFLNVNSLLVEYLYVHVILGDVDYIRVMMYFTHPPLLVTVLLLVKNSGLL